MNYIINKFEDSGIFNSTSSFINKDNEKCIVGKFEGKRKEFTFILSDKDKTLTSS